LRAFIIGMLLAGGLWAQGAAGGLAPHNVANITGTGAQVQVYAAGGLARYIQFIAPAGNAATVEIGDSTTTSTTGNPVAAGGGYATVPIACAPNALLSTCTYQLSGFYAYIANGDKLSVVAYW
jgi:hypothetical protein